MFHRRYEMFRSVFYDDFAFYFIAIIKETHRISSRTDYRVQVARFNRTNSWYITLHIKKIFNNITGKLCILNIKPSYYWGRRGALAQRLTENARVMCSIPFKNSAILWAIFRIYEESGNGVSCCWAVWYIYIFDVTHCPFLRHTNNITSFYCTFYRRICIENFHVLSIHLNSKFDMLYKKNTIIHFPEWESNSQYL